MVMILWLVLLKSLGIALYVAIVRQREGIAPGFVAAFCTLGESVNCSKVLHSKASRFLGLVDMVDVGIAYFGGGLIVALVALCGFRTEENMIILLSLPWLSIPYLVFSLYYQYVVVKKWCTLCLSVLCVLVLEMVLSVYSLHFPIDYWLYWRELFFVLTVCLLMGCVGHLTVNNIRKEG